MATVIQSIAPKLSESCSSENGSSTQLRVQPLQRAQEPWVPDAERISVIAEAACEIMELAELIADGIDDETPAISAKLSPRLLQRLNQRLYQLASAQLACLDQHDDVPPPLFAARLFPRTCAELGEQG